MKTTPLLILGALCVLPSCSQFSAHPVKLSDFSLRNMNPFRKNLPIRDLSEEELAALQDRTIAAHNAEGIPDTSLRPVDFTPPGLPQGLDLSHSSLLPPKAGNTPAVIHAEGEVPGHQPIMPVDLLDDDDIDNVSPESLIEEAPLVPHAPTTLEVTAAGEGPASEDQEDPSSDSPPLPPLESPLEGGLTDEVAKTGPSFGT